MITTTEAKKIKIEDIFIEVGQEFNDGWIIKDIYSSTQKYKTIILFENKNNGVLRKLDKATILANYKKTGEIKLSYEKSYDLVAGDSFRSKDSTTIKVIEINSEENKILFENSGIEIWLSFKTVNQIDRISGLENSNMFTLKGFYRQKNLEVGNIIPLSGDVYCQIEFIEDGYIHFKDSRGWDFRVQKSTFFKSELLHQSEAEIIDSSINYQKIKIYYENKILIEDKYIIIDDEYIEDNSSKKKKVLFEEIETGYIYIWNRQSLNNYFSGKVKFNPTFLRAKKTIDDDKIIEDSSSLAKKSKVQTLLEKYEPIILDLPEFELKTEVNNSEDDEIETENQLISEEVQEETLNHNNNYIFEDLLKEDLEKINKIKELLEYENRKLELQAKILYIETLGKLIDGKI